VEATELTGENRFVFATTIAKFGSTIAKFAG